MLSEGTLRGFRTRAIIVAYLTAPEAHGDLKTGFLGEMSIETVGGTDFATLIHEQGRVLSRKKRPPLAEVPEVAGSP